MNDQLRAVIEKVHASPKLSPEAQQQIVKDLTGSFEGWFMDTENQAPMTRFETSIVKTAFAWLVDQISK